MDYLEILLMRLKMNRVLFPTELTFNIQSIIDYLKMNQVKGDYAEFGVSEGLSFITVWKYYKLYDYLEDVHFHAFDSFEGLPNIELDIDKGNIFKKGMFACSLDKFKRNLKRAKVDVKSVVFHKGFFKREELNLINFPVAFAFVDCDLYASAKEIMDFIKRNVVDGGIVYFDNWYSYKGDDDKGERKSLYEFFNPWEYQDFPVSGIRKAFIIRKPPI